MHRSRRASPRCKELKIMTINLRKFLRIKNVEGKGAEILFLFCLYTPWVNVHTCILDVKEAPM